MCRVVRTPALGFPFTREALAGWMEGIDYRHSGRAGLEPVLPEPEQPPAPAPVVEAPASRLYKPGRRRKQ